jgi:hypothetical protein
VRSSPRGVLGRALARGTRWRARLHHDGAGCFGVSASGYLWFAFQGLVGEIASHNKGGADVTNGAMGPSPAGGGVVGLLQARGRPSPADPVVDGGLGFLCLGAGHWPARCPLPCRSGQVRMHDDPAPAELGMDRSSLRMGPGVSLWGLRRWGSAAERQLWFSPRSHRSVTTACHLYAEAGATLGVLSGIGERDRPASNVASGPVVARVNQARAQLVGHAWPFAPR